MSLIWQNLLGRSLSGGRAGAACPRVGKLAAAAATFWAEGRLLIFGGSMRLAASRLSSQLLQHSKR